jgi:hypothetical protein
LDKAENLAAIEAESGQGPWIQENYLKVKYYGYTDAALDRIYEFPLSPKEGSPAIK